MDGPIHSAPVSLSDGTATERFVQSFIYDASNNMTRLRHVGGTANFTVDFWIDPASNRSRPLLGPGGQPVVDPGADFAASGEMRRMDHIASLEWRHDQRLARAVVIDRSANGQPDDDEIYLYDSGGTRMRKVTRRLLGDGSIERVEATYLAGAEIRRIFRNNTLILERFVTRISDGFSEFAELHRWSRDDTARETDDPGSHRIRYTLSDHLGSATLRLDEGARIISYEEFLPYGQRAFAAGDDVRELALKVYGFIGRERDAVTGLHHIGQRYYACWLCRWLSPDPGGDEDGPNLYQYAHANPVTYFDPTGLQTTDNRERGQVTSRSISSFPPEVIAAARALPEDKKKEYRALIAAGNFTYYIDHTGQVHFGTIADMRAMAEARLAEGGDVVVVSVSSGDGDSEGGGSGGDETDTEPETPTDQLPPIASAGGHGDPDGRNDGSKDGKGKGNGEGDGDDTKSKTKGKGKNKNGGTGVGDEKGTEGGKGAIADSDENGEGGGGTSEDPNAKGKGKKGTGLGGGKGDPGKTGTGQTPGQGRPGGTGTGTGTGTKPGGKKGGVAGGIEGGTGTDPNAKGTIPGGVKGGKGSDPGGRVGGEEGGVAGGKVGGSLDGTEGGNATEGSGNPQSGNGGSSSAPGGGGGAKEGAGASDNGKKDGSAQGSGQPGNAKNKRGPGGAQQPATVMDHVVRVAGWWNLEFSSKPGGSQTGGVPGGMGNMDLGRWGQALYVALTVVDVVLTVLSLGGLAAIKAALKTALKASMRTLASLGRKAMAALSVKNLRGLAQRSVAQLSFWQDKAVRWLGSDFMLHSKFYHWAMGKGGWRAKIADSAVGRWFLYGMNGGASATRQGVQKFLGFWPYAKTTIVNNATRLPDKIDNFFHEGVHAATNLLAWPVKQLMEKTVKGQPVFAVINYLDEVAAYSAGRIASLRLHALPAAPFNAFVSTYMYYGTKGRAAIGWSVAGLGAIGASAYGAYRYLTGQDEPQPEVAP